MNIPSSALEAQARVYERWNQAHTQRLKSQTKQTEDDMYAVASRSSSTRGRLYENSEAADIPSNETQDPSMSTTHQGTRARSARAHTMSESRLTIDDLARSFENIPESTLEAQVREYERLHQIHTQRIQSQTNLTKDGMDAAPSSGSDSRDSRSSSTYGTQHQAHEAASIPSNDPQINVAQSSNRPIATDPKAGQQLATLGDAGGNSCGIEAGSKPLPEQCLSYGIPNKTKYHTKLVTCPFCSSNLYTAPSTVIFYCQECGISSYVEVEKVECWDRSSSDGKEKERA